MNSLSVSGLIGYGLMEMFKTKTRNNEKIDEILKEYHEETIKLPRRKKKQRRKELKLDYQIFKSFDDMFDGFKIFNK